MKQTNLTAIFAAGAVCFAVQAGASEATNSWFSVNFTNSTELASGRWTKGSGDDSAITSSDVPAGAEQTSVLKFETNGKNLVYNPETPAPAGEKTVVESLIYLIGTDKVPEFTAGAQTEVYLSTAAGDAGLKANINGTWTTIASDVTAGWHEIAVVMDYSGATPKAFFQLDGSAVGSASGYALTGSNAGKTSVDHLAFAGSGYVDNFAGKNVIAIPAMYDNNGGSSDADATVNTTIAGVDTANKNITFKTAKASDAIKFIRVYTDSTHYKTLRVTGAATVPYDGAEKVVAYYGSLVSNVTAADAPATTVDVAAGEAELAVTNTKSGLYYGLYDVTDASKAPILKSSFLAGFNDDNVTKVFADKMEASEEAWGVVKFVVKASDEDPASN